MKVAGTATPESKQFDLARSVDGTRQPAWVRLLPVALLTALLILLLSRFLHREDVFLSFFEDDFFYYLVIAKNLVLHHTLTFNGIQLTNGFHPLWFTVIAALYRTFGDGQALFLAIVLLIWSLACAAYVTFRRAQVALGAPAALGIGCALLSVTFMGLLSRTGMEVSLALFLLALLWQRLAATPLDQQTPRAAFLSGLVAAGVILSRVDALIAVGAYCALMLYRPIAGRKAVLRALLWFAIGLFPVWAYLVYNRYAFGAFLPLSSVAKNLKEGLVPSISTYRVLFKPRLINVLFTWPALLLTLAFAQRLLRDGRTGFAADPAARRVQLAVLLHPWSFYTVLTFTSDWTIWTWYLYPLAPVAALLGPTVLASVGRNRRAQGSNRRAQGSNRWAQGSDRRARYTTWFPAATAAVCVLSLLSLLHVNAMGYVIYQQARDLQAFSENRPGRYAMGAGAGMPAYLMDSPVLQVEGLTADSAFLERLRHRQPLVQALRELDVDYYATMFPRRQGSCFDLREPEMAGNRSPVMAGHSCVQPVATFPHDGAEDLVVFDVRALSHAAELEAE